MVTSIRRRKKMSTDKREYDAKIWLGKVHRHCNFGPRNIDEWLSDVDNNKSIEYVERLGRRIVGVDVLKPPSNSGDVKPIGTLQLCVGRHCLVYKISLSRFIPLSLPRFLSDQKYIFVGTDVAGKLDKLSNDYYIRFRAPPASVELGGRIAFRHKQPELETGNLKLFAKLVFLAKLPARQSLQDQWNATETTLQVFDAAAGAYVSFRLGWSFRIALS